MTTRYVIVGNGAAGATAARTIREHDASADIQIVGAEKHAFYSRPGLAYYLAGQLPEGALFSRPDKDLERAHVKRTVGRVTSVDPRAHRIELADIQIVGAEKHAFYSRPGLAYYLAGQLPEGALFSRPDKELERADVKRTVGRVASVDQRAHRLELADGKVLRYDRLLLGVGAKAVRPEVDGIELDGVVTLDSLEDARLILKIAKRAKRAVVVGGGITALELAEGLAANGVATRYLMRGDRYWASVLDERESALVEERLGHDGVVLHRNTELARVIGHKHRVTAVETKDGERIEADMLAVAVGTQVRLELAKQIGLATGRGIFTDDTLMTSEPDIYAAGDAAEVLDPVTGRRSVDSLWSVAIAQGRVAGANMAGGSMSCMPRPAPFNVTKLGGVTTTLIGAVGAGGRDGDLIALSRGDSTAWREQLDGFAVDTDSGANHLRLILSEDRILGAVVMGDQTLSRPLLQVIRDRLDIREVRDRLLASQGEVREALAQVLDRVAYAV